MKRRDRRRLGFVAASAAVIVVGWIGAPRAIRMMPVFRVRRIELAGIRYLAPDSIVHALRLTSESSVFTDAQLLRDRVKGVAGVADATIERRLPGTLEIVVQEVEPAAFIAGPRGELFPVDAHGVVLPFDPARARIDLPVAAARDTALLRVLALVATVDPDFSAVVTTARVLPRGAGIALDCTTSRVLFARDAGVEDVRAALLVQQDLKRRRRRYTELDARFAGQVVVRARRDHSTPASLTGTGE